MCLVRSSRRKLSKIRHGIRNITVKNENTMPFANTIPMSTPMPKRITVSERKPKNVTAALESTTEKPRFMAWAMATSGSANSRWQRRNVCSKTMA